MHGEIQPLLRKKRFNFSIEKIDISTNVKILKMWKCKNVKMQNCKNLRTYKLTDVQILNIQTNKYIYVHIYKKVKM